MCTRFLTWIEGGRFLYDQVRELALVAVVGGVAVVSRVRSGMGTVVISGLNMSRTRMMTATDFAGSLNTSSLSAIRLVVRFRGRFNVGVPSSRTRGVTAMNSTVDCVRTGTWSWALFVRLGEIIMAKLNTIAPLKGATRRA